MRSVSFSRSAFAFLIDKKIDEMLLNGMHFFWRVLCMNSPCAERSSNRCSIPDAGFPHCVFQEINTRQNGFPVGTGEFLCKGKIREPDVPSRSPGGVINCLNERRKK